MWQQGAEEEQGGLACTGGDCAHGVGVPYSSSSVLNRDCSCKAAAFSMGIAAVRQQRSQWGLQL